MLEYIKSMLAYAMFTIYFSNISYKNVVHACELERVVPCNKLL